MSGPAPGDRTRAYFAARGVDLSPGESRELAIALLRLADLGALTGMPDAAHRGSSPKTPAPAGVSCADRGAGAGCGTREAGAAEGPTVYNMGPSDYTEAQP